MNRLFVFDIDGTLIDRDYILKGETIACIDNLLEQGDYIATCSGRSFVASNKFMSRFSGDNKYLICANGASVYDKDGNLLKAHHLKYKDFLKVYNITSKVEEFYTYFYKDSKLGLKVYDPIIELDKASGDMSDFLVDDNYDLNTPIEKIMVRDKTKKLLKTYKIPRIFKIKYNAIRSAKVFIEITNKKASKGSGVEFLRKYLHIKKNDVYVFGDSGNDISMFKMFKKNSVAMGNAIPEVKDKARHISKSIKENGVAYALKHILNVVSEEE